MQSDSDETISNETIASESQATETESVNSPVGVSIRASAGSGKTFQLSQRYIELLLEGTDAGQILATTFTRKAAGEIQRRILQRIAGVASNAGRLTEFCKLYGNSIPQEQFVKVLASTIRSLHRLNVGTLDSLCQRIAIPLSLEIGLPQNWSIVDYSVLQTLKLEAIGLALQDEREFAATLYRQLTKGETDSAIVAQIRNAIDENWDVYLRSEPQAWKRLEETINRPLSEEELSQVCERIRSLELPKTKKGDPKRRWKNAIEKILDCIDAESWEGLLKLTIVQNVSGRELFVRSRSDRRKGAYGAREDDRPCDRKTAFDLRLTDFLDVSTSSNVRPALQKSASGEPFVLFQRRQRSFVRIFRNGSSISKPKCESIRLSGTYCWTNSRTLP